MKLIKKLIKSIINNIKLKFFNDVNRKHDDIKFQSAFSFFEIRKKEYDTVKSLEEVNFKVFSQNGEDGIVDYLLNRLNIIKPKFIEIGVGDFSECNTRYIYKKNYPKGLIIDIEKNFQSKVSKIEDIWKGGLIVIEDEINTENINSIIEQNGFSNNVDLFSLDIDGVDYWIIESLPKNFSKIAVAEYNPYFGSEHQITVPNISKFNRTKYHYSNLCFGCSLSALIKVMESKNMKFVGSNNFKNNAFFINNDFINKLNIIFPDTKKLGNFTDANFLESRDKNYKKNYIQTENILKEIQSCKVINLKNNSSVLLKDLFN